MLIFLAHHAIEVSISVVIVAPGEAVRKQKCEKLEIERP